MRIFKALRSPESQFEGLNEYDFSPNYIEVDGLRMHYVDEGLKTAIPILLLHGEPSWSYLYRNMIPPLAEAGFRVVAPDFIGFGKSDKMTQTRDYSYQRHVDWMTGFFEKLALSDVTLFCQDWGGLIGLRVLARKPHAFARVIAGNTGLPAASGLQGFIGHSMIKFKVRRIKIPEDGTPPEHMDLLNWIAYSQKVENLQIGQVLQMGTKTELPPEVIHAYNAPFPSEHYKAGARIFPYLVTSQLRKNNQVWNEVLSKWEKPFLTAFSDGDPITRGTDRYFQKRIPGAQDQNHQTIKDAGHFLQEDKGEELVRIILDFISSTS